MATTLLEYKTAVASAGFDSVTSSDAILDAINEARQSLVEERRWSWLTVGGNTTLALAYDTPSVGIDSLSGIPDVAYVDAVRIEIGTTYVPLDYLTPEQLRDKEHIDRSPSVPLYWTEAASQLRFYPSPDQAYTVSLDYIKTITALVSDVDTDDVIPPAFKALVKWKAAEALFVRVRDYQGAQKAQQMYESELRRKAGQDGITQRQTSQQVLRNPRRYS